MKEIYRGLVVDSIDILGNKLGQEKGLEYLMKLAPKLKKDTAVSLLIHNEYNSLFRTWISIQNN